ncbi:MAG: macro domain-containing protein [Thermodesulfobacteriota bacterium]
MIEYKQGDILKENAEALVNTVNCVGVMGRGIALQFKKAFPENFKAYAKVCKLGQLKPGRLFVYETGQWTGPRYIINFPTKRHWRGKSRMEDIDSGLSALVEDVEKRGIRSVAIPPLGSGLGGLDWEQVRRRIEKTAEKLPEVQIIVFEPKGAPSAEKMVYYQEAPKMTAGRAALVGLMARYLAGLLDPFVTLLEIHKLMYFLQTTGEPLRLNYAKGPYGPYAENLRHVLNKVEGHLISGFSDGADDPRKELNLVPGASEDAAAFLKHHSQTRGRFDRVSDLVEGFETPYGLELLSSVHWVVQNEPVRNLEDVIRHTHAWNNRKKRFSPRQIGIAVDTLAEKRWIQGFH